MGIGDSLKSGFSELTDEGDFTSAPRSGKSTRQSSFSLFRASDNDVYRPPDEEMHKYWRAFEEMPYVRKAITSYAREVVEPGWWIEADNDEQAENIAKWLRHAAIVDGQKGQDFALLLKKAVIQREVRGTCLVEHVPDADSDAVAAMKLINPETVTTFTKKDSSILLEPGDDRPADVPASNGETPAYVQFYEPRFNQDMVPFTQDEITKLVRDADIGDPYGTSILKPIYPRIESYREKLNDLDAAIKHKAWQVWIFQFGPDEDPWHPDDIDDFMDEEAKDAFTPGTKHGVQGDIDVETVGGEVPDIQDELEHDISHIMSSMPMPKWAIEQTSEINQHIAQQQENLLRSQVQEARRSLEYRFQEIVDKKAEELGYDPDTIKLHVSNPDSEEPNPYEDRGTVIRYQSDAGDDEGEAGNQEAGEESSGDSGDSAQQE